MIHILELAEKNFRITMTMLWKKIKEDGQKVLKWQTPVEKWICKENQINSLELKIPI